MVGVGRDLWRSSSPSPLPKLVNLEQAAQDLIQAGFEYLQRRRLRNLSGQPVPVLCHLQSKEVLPQVAGKSSTVILLKSVKAYSGSVCGSQSHSMDCS